MSYRICLDAGHYGKYNQSPANKKYYESDMNWKLHLMLKAELEAYGFEVITTRDVQEKDRGLYSRGVASRGCNLFISIHSNAVGSGVNNTIDFPVAYVLLNGTSTDIGLKLSKTVEYVIGTNQPGRTSTRRGAHGEWYGVLRGADAVGTPGIILEHSFHTNKIVTNWLLRDANLKKLAQAEARCIAEHYGLKKQVDGDNTPTTFKPYLARVSINNLNIRKGPGTENPTLGIYTGKGVFTIVDEAEGVGATKWGLLKAYAEKRNGWISLDYAKKI